MRKEPFDPDEPIRFGQVWAANNRRHLVIGPGKHSFMVGEGLPVVYDWITLAKYRVWKRLA